VSRRFAWLAAPVALGLLAPGALLAQSKTGAASAAPTTPDPGEDQVVNVRRDDPAMVAAIAEARRTLPEFLRMLATPDPLISNVVFKYPLDGKEHIWVDHVARDGDYLTGRLANEPVLAGYAYQQDVRVKLSDVSDWAYRDAAGIMQGHRTTRAMLGRIDPALAKDILADFRWEADK
jgi:uncharacterized protein YegJ (DUF2314 family)